jgi:transcriptional pleiotropic regulator of transition state genes
VKSTGVVRQVDQLGRVVIPKSLRKTYELESGARFEVGIDADFIYINKYIPSCCLCEEKSESFREFKGKNICVTCLEDMKK